MSICLNGVTSLAYLWHFKKKRILLHEDSNSCTLWQTHVLSQSVSLTSWDLQPATKSLKCQFSLEYLRTYKKKKFRVLVFVHVKGLSRGKLHLISTMRDILLAHLKACHVYEIMVIRGAAGIMVINLSSTKMTQCWSVLVQVTDRNAEIALTRSSQNQLSQVGAARANIDQHGLARDMYELSCTATQQKAYIETHFFHFCPLKWKGQQSISYPNINPYTHQYGFGASPT